VYKSGVLFLNRVVVDFAFLFLFYIRS